MRAGRIAATTMVAIMIAQVLSGQTPMKPTAPGTPGDPNWQGVVRMSDGRTFVTDGGLAIDAALVKPATLPGRELAGKVLEGYLNAAHNEEYSLVELTAAVSGKTYSAPNGIALNATYINYLRRALPSRGVRLRLTGPREPIVIVVSGQAVGVLMPVAQ